MLLVTNRGRSAEFPATLTEKTREITRVQILTKQIIVFIGYALTQEKAYVNSCAIEKHMWNVVCFESLCFTCAQTEQLTNVDIFTDFSSSPFSLIIVFNCVYRVCHKVILLVGCKWCLSAPCPFRLLSPFAFLLFAIMILHSIKWWIEFFLNVQVSTLTIRFRKSLRSEKHHILHSRILNICIRTRLFFCQRQWPLNLNQK